MGRKERRLERLCQGTLSWETGEARCGSGVKGRQHRVGEHGVAIALLWWRQLATASHTWVGEGDARRGWMPPSHSQWVSPTPSGCPGAAAPGATPTSSLPRHRARDETLVHFSSPS